jgi:hypothetical protein
MPLEEFIITVFCLVDDTYHNLLPHPVRKRGTPPKLTDSEVITMEIVGEWLGRHTDKAIWTYFHQHWSSLFPSIPSRPQFARQAANLWAIKDKIHSYIVTILGADTSGIYLIDGFPVDVCVTTRVKRSRLFKGEAAFGYCASKKKHFYGFQANLLTDARGIPLKISLTAANIDERDTAYELIDSIEGLLIGDKGYIRPELTEDCRKQGLNLQTPLRKNMHDTRPKEDVSLLMNVRRRIETVIGHLAEYFEIERCRCRDLWHLTSRVNRKLLAYTIGMYLNIQACNEPMQFENMITA